MALLSAPSTIRMSSAIKVIAPVMTSATVSVEVLSLYHLSLLPVFIGSRSVLVTVHDDAHG
jgi:hypothetical protein